VVGVQPPAPVQLHRIDQRALAALDPALDIRRARPPDADDYAVDLYVSLTNLGLLRTETGSLDSARRLYGDAVELCEKRLEGDPAATS
jgi:hypothetical protein